MEAARANRLYEELHNEASGRTWHDGTFTTWSSKFSPSTPNRYDDAVTIWAAAYDVNPDDDFLEQGADQQAQPPG